MSNESKDNDCNTENDILFDLRMSVVIYIGHIIQFICKKYKIKGINAEINAEKIENDLYDNLDDIKYIQIVSSDLNKILTYQDGMFPDDCLVLKYIRNEINIDKMLSTELVEQNPRERITSMFNSLLFTHTDKDKIYISNLSKQIESICHDSVIRNSRKLEDPPCRLWSSPVFLEMYSTKCGMIFNLLNPDSTTNKLYESKLLDQILSGQVEDIIKDKSERCLCPKALEEEIKEINLRNEQKITENKSNLFKCGKCGFSEVTYREVQLRSIDEAPDYFCKCLKCGNVFKGH
jgi:DNA-directed RNA polymerase subunit M/transcription elongation factor TFIIS